MSLIRLLFGRRLASGEEPSQQVGPLSGVAVLGLDALASAAYGPEAALTVLRPVGATAGTVVVTMSLVIVAVLVTVYLSYRQTIDAYPNGGGSYTVARENLGPVAGVVAAAALGFDYALNVAVAISAGVGALVSAVPALNGHVLALCLAILALLTFMNLRGMRETGLLLMLPTYAFVGCILFVIALAGGRALLGQAHAAVATAAGLPGAPASAWLLLRAFSSGCTALTGVEAVSNGVPVFRPPKQHHAKTTLTLIIGALAVLLLGLAGLTRAYDVRATEPGSPSYQSVISQVVELGVGRSWFYYVAMAATLSVLCLSANTSFAGFPRLCRLLACDEYAPSGFRHRGRRLAFTAGIASLALFAFALLIAFDGVTDRLIPLFAVGAFLAFTMSQTGMVGHWWRRRAERGAWHRLAINAIGAFATAATLLVIVVSKFVEGAWLAVVAIPAAMTGLLALHRHYRTVDEVLVDDAPLSPSDRQEPPLVLVPLRCWNRVARKAVLFGTAIGAPVHALQVLDEESASADLSARWPALVQGLGEAAPELTVLFSPYRRVHTAVLEFAQRLARVHPGRHVAVVVPELVERRWYHLILHAHRATILSALLILRGGPQIVVVRTPWYLRD